MLYIYTYIVIFKSHSYCSNTRREFHPFPASLLLELSDSLLLELSDPSSMAGPTTHLVENSPGLLWFMVMVDICGYIG